MDLKITGIRYENIREFENVELDFANGSNDNPHHISLVQMPNGTGKTTTMNLIRTTLLGKEMDQDEVRSYQPSDFDAIEGAFEIDLVSSDEHSHSALNSTTKLETTPTGTSNQKK